MVVVSLSYVPLLVQSKRYLILPVAVPPTSAERSTPFRGAVPDTPVDEKL